MIFYNITLLGEQILSDTTTVVSRDYSNVYMSENKWKLPTSVKCHGANPHWNQFLTVQLMPMEYFTYNSKKIYNFWTLWVIFIQNTITCKVTTFQWLQLSYFSQLFQCIFTVVLMFCFILVRFLCNAAFVAHS